MRILVTGGAGFIGSQLAHRLVREHHDVVVIDNLSTGLKRNVPEGAKFLKLDVSQNHFTSKLPKGRFDAVCHLAAQSSGELSAIDPLYDVQTNALSTLQLSRWCVKNKVPRFLYASSMAIYGNAKALPVTEASATMPLSYYGTSKLVSEHFLRLTERDGLRATSLRMFSVYGPGQNLKNLKQGMLSIYLAYLLQKKEVPVTGSLDRVRDFVYIDDVVDIWMTLLSRPESFSPVYNVGSGKPTSVKAVLNALVTELKLPANHPIRVLPGQTGDQFGLYAAIDLAQKDLQWKPHTDLQTGIRKMVAWARDL